MVGVRLRPVFPPWDEALWAQRVAAPLGTTQDLHLLASVMHERGMYLVMDMAVPGQAVSQTHTIR